MLTSQQSQEIQKIWISLEEVCAITGIAPPTLKRKCAARLIHPLCGRKMAGRWKFRREVIEERGIVCIDDPDASVLSAA